MSTGLMAAFRLIVPMALSAIFVACGGQGDDEPLEGTRHASAAGTPPASTQPLTSERLQWLPPEGLECEGLRLSDSGHVLYITVPVDCQIAFPISIALRYRLNGQEARAWAPIAGFDDPLEIEILAGTRREVSIHRRGTWRAIANSDSWQWRDGAGLLVKDGGLYLLGGWSGTPFLNNDVWFTRDLLRWNLITSAAPWQGRHGAGWVVHRNRLYVVGGDLYPDVWSSVDGREWDRETAAAGFGGRYTPIAASLGDRLFVYGGLVWGPSDWCSFAPECYVSGFNDVWTSNTGRDWSLLSPRAGWSGRGLIHGSMVFKGRIFVISGGLKLASPGDLLAETVEEFNDVWSSADGVQWRKEADDAGFSPRTHVAMLATDHGCYVAGGSVRLQLETTNEVYFAADCIRFSPLPAPPELGRRHAASLAFFNGSVVLLGGHRDTAGTTIWQYFPVE